MANSKSLVSDCNRALLEIGALDPADLSRRVEIGLRALETCTPEQDAPGWANLNLVLGRDLINASGGSVELVGWAHGCLEDALTVYTFEQDREAWAEAHRWLAIGFDLLPADDDGANLEQARVHYQAALRGWPDDEHVYRADLEVGLARCYARREVGEPAENLAQAIEHYGLALALGPREADPLTWAQLQVELGLCHSRRAVADRAPDVEAAIDCFEQALSVYGPGAAPAAVEATPNWSIVHNALAEVYRVRPDGRPADNLEEAIRHLEMANEALYTLDDEVLADPQLIQHWARIQENLGVSFLHRPTGDDADNINRALGHLETALEIWDSAGDRRRQAWVHGLLGDGFMAAAHLNLVNGNYDGYAPLQQRGIEHTEQALRLCDRDEFPEEWAELHTSLARMLIASDLRGAASAEVIDHYQRALEVYSFDRHPLTWLQTHVDLAEAHLRRYELDRATQLALAIEHFDRVLEMFTPELSPDRHRNVQHKLGDLCFGENRWEQAHRAYAAALAAEEQLLAVTAARPARRERLEKLSYLHARMAHCLVQAGRPGEALVTMEGGKAQLLAEALAGARPESRQPTAEQIAVVAETARLIEAVRSENRYPVGLVLRRSTSELERLELELEAQRNEVLAQIRAANPVPPTPRLDLGDILALAPEGGALVLPLITDAGSFAFVLPHGLVDVGPEQVVATRAYTNMIFDSLFGSETMGTADYGWLRAYRQRDRELALNSRVIGLLLPDEERAGEQPWAVLLERFLGLMWQALAAPVHERLQALGLRQGAPVTIILQGGLAMLPLHAAWTTETHDGRLRHLLDDYAISYAPSALALSVARSRLPEPRRQGRSLLAVIDPTGDLPFATMEGRLVARQFAGWQVATLAGEAATREAVAGAVSGQSCVHLACHGWFAWEDSLHSGLVLAGGEPLTLADIPGSLDLSQARLVTLSACEAGAAEVDRLLDEYAGLPGVLMEVGAPAVLSGLWLVNDLCTALLVERFYSGYLGGLAPAAALREAQLWLRDVTAGELAERFRVERDRPEAERVVPFEDATMVRRYFQAREPDERPYAHPAYWAAFALLGG